MQNELPGQRIEAKGIHQGPAYTKTCPFGGQIGTAAHQGNVIPSNAVITDAGDPITTDAGDFVVTD